MRLLLIKFDLINNNIYELLTYELKCKYKFTECLNYFLFYTPRQLNPCAYLCFDLFACAIRYDYLCYLTDLAESTMVL